MPQQIQSAILDGGGGATIRLEPAKLQRYWVYNRISISISTGTASAATFGECFMYRGEPNQGNFVTSSRLPWNDIAGLDPITGRLTSPEYWSFVFENCDPGATATVVAEFTEAPL